MRLSRLTVHRLAVPSLLACGIVATLGREIVFAHYLGVSRELEVFRVAFALPNMLSQSLASAFIGALLPALVVAAQGSSADFDVFCRRLTRVTVRGIAFIAVIGILSASPQAALLAPGFDAGSQRTLSVALALCWVFFLFTALSFLPRLFLHNRQEFWPGSSAGAVVSVCLIGAALIAGGLPGSNVALMLVLGTIVAGGLILALHAWREPRPFRVLLAAFRPGQTALDATSGPILMPLLFVLSLHVINALPRFVDRAVGSEIAPGIVAALDYSFNIITVPGILLGTSVITVFYPAFVHSVKNQQRRGLDKRIAWVVLSVLVLAMISGLCIFYFATDIVRLIYARGAFDDAAVATTSTLLAWHGLGLGFMVTALVFLQACLAYSVFPLLLGIAIARLVSKWLAVEWLVPRYGLDGLGASFIVPEAVSAVLLIAVSIMLLRSDRTN